MKLSRKAIVIIITVVISLVCLGIVAKFVMAYLLLPEEKQSISFYKQCYASGGTIKSMHGSQCGGDTCWDLIQLGTQNCGYGEGLFADCFCGVDRCWDDAVGGCVSKEEYGKQYGEAVWQQYQLTTIADALADAKSNTYRFQDTRFQGTIQAGSAIVDMPDGYDKKTDYCNAPYYFNDGTTTVRILNNYAQYSGKGTVEIIGHIFEQQCNTPCVCDVLLKITAIRLLK